MPFPYKFLLLSLAVACFSLGNSCGRDLVAIVNGEPIVREYFEQALRIEAMKYDRITLRDARSLVHLKEEVLQHLIRDTLIAQEAVKSGIQPTEAELAEIYVEYKGHYTEQSFQQMLQNKGINYSAWKAFRKTQYTIERFAQQAMAKQITIAPAAIQHYYRAHQAEFVEPASVRVRQIVTEDEATAKQLREKILKGANFAELAMGYSLTPDGKEGGDLGYIPKGSFPAVFDQVCFRLPAGAMSDVVKSEYGYHLFKVLDHRPARVIPLNEVQQEIESRLRQEEADRIFDRWVEPFQTNAKIAIYKDAVARAVVKEIPHAK